MLLDICCARAWNNKDNHGIAVEVLKQRKSILICTVWLIGYVSITLTYNTPKWTFIVLVPRQICC